jgi:DNA-binding LytR/AlgR family response regulator
MPQMSGYQVCEKIRAKYSFQELPILFLTALNQVQDLVQGFDVGGNDYLAKPFSRAELLARVETQLHIRVGTDRLLQLRAFSNQLAQFDSSQALIKRAYEILCLDPWISKAAFFSEKKLMEGNLGENVDYPVELKEKEEYNSLQDENQLLYLKREGYALAACFPTSRVTETWIRIVAAQVRKSAEQIKKLIFDPILSPIMDMIYKKREKILYVKAEGNYSVFHFVDEKEQEIKLGIGQISDYVDLVEVHRSYLVNPSKIQKIEKKDQKLMLKIGGVEFSMTKNQKKIKECRPELF